MRPKVYIAWPIPEEVIAYLHEHCDCRIWQGDSPIGDDQLKHELMDAEGLLLGEGRVDAELLEKAPNLRVVSNISAGYNNLDIEAMKKRNVIGTHNPGVSSHSVADLALGLMLAAARKINTLDRYVKEGHWKAEADDALFGMDVHHSTVGILGLGSIGMEIARRARFGFNMNVLYYSRSRKPEAETTVGVVYLPLNELLAQADFIVVVLPLTAETEHFIGERHFRLMKKSAILINVSRGRIIQEQALIEALVAGRIRAAALDVFEKEPVDPQNPLLSMNNVITLPHIGSATAQTRFNLYMSAAQNLVSALKGETPPFLIKEFRQGNQS